MKQLTFSKRKFLNSMGVVFLGLFWKDRSEASSLAIGQNNFIKVLARSIEEIVIPPVSRNFLDTTSGFDELEAELLLIASPKDQTGIGASGDTPQENPIALSIREDFERGRVRNVGGWYISETEYLTLSYIARYS